MRGRGSRGVGKNSKDRELPESRTWIGLSQPDLKVQALHQSTLAFWSEQGSGSNFNPSDCSRSPSFSCQVMPEMAISLCQLEWLLPGLVTTLKPSVWLNDLLFCILIQRIMVAWSYRRNTTVNPCLLSGFAQVTCLSELHSCHFSKKMVVTALPIL